MLPIAAACYLGIPLMTTQYQYQILQVVAMRQLFTGAATTGTGDAALALLDRESATGGWLVLVVPWYRVDAAAAALVVLLGLYIAAVCSSNILILNASPAASWSPLAALLDTTERQSVRTRSRH